MHVPSNILDIGLVKNPPTYTFLEYLTENIRREISTLYILCFYQKQNKKNGVELY